MDPETIRLLVPVVGTLGGVGITGLIAYAIARLNSRAQRQIDTDKARREYRLRQVQPLLDRAGRRLGRLQAFMLAGLEPNVGTNPQPLRDAWQRVLDEDLTADMGYVSVSSSPFHEALLGVVTADADLRRVVMQIVGDYDPRTATPDQKAQLRDQLLNASRPYVTALAALNAAGESYIFDDNPDVAPSRWLRLPWG